ncbi:MAG: hypothetical protein IJ086_15880 [Clostridium sp.]|nr:hypothetical protein [Clostridium sp.]MBQ9000154.1 hypothetical protein [Clostridium sp.]
MKELKNKKDIEFIEKELFKKDKIEIFCKTSLILSYAMFFLILLLLIIQIIFKELTQDSIIIYTILLIISILLIRYNNIELEKNRYKLVMKFIEEYSKKSR